MTAFTPLTAIIGGLLIGIAALLLVLLNGRILGVSGIVANSWSLSKSSRWRWIFLFGLVISPLFVSKEFAALPAQLSITWTEAVIGGFLVGIGTRIGSGCTSGHGVCGIGRLSVRSIVATCIFVLTAIVVVFITRHILR